MKYIIAYVKSNMLGKVVQALHGIEGLTGLSITDIHGFGRGRGEGESVFITVDSIKYVPHKKIELFCHDNIAEMVADTIQKAAHTGLRGDGKVYVLSVDQAIRISTGEIGEGAI
ncbi:MAG TPA: P-II family nitrogen regulator [Bacteroidetes bacterium]|nr:P-II family nitrogen regulator [Bacteroidota bacterium]HEX05454.1 P-II family nitrogen regulator [Bacteroidota bacterium]